MHISLGRDKFESPQNYDMEINLRGIAGGPNVSYLKALSISLSLSLANGYFLVHVASKVSKLTRLLNGEIGAPVGYEPGSLLATFGVLGQPGQQ